MADKRLIKADPFFTWDLLRWFSHRFQNSCVLVTGYAGLLEKDTSLTESQRKDIVKIKECAIQMQDQLSEIGKIVSGVKEDGFNVPVSEFNMFDAVDYGALNFLPPRDPDYNAYTKKIIPVNYRGKPYRERKKHNITAVGHEDLSGLALVNLFSNAAKYGKTKIDVDVRKKGKHVETIISNDSEAGIPEEYLEKVFEPYSVVPGNENRGQGIGLYLSRRMARAQGGDVWLEGEGDIVRAYFRLPATQ